MSTRDIGIEQAIKTRGSDKRCITIDVAMRVMFFRNDAEPIDHGERLFPNTFFVANVSKCK